MGGAMNWRQRLGAFIGGFDAGQHHRRLRGFRATRAHVNALIAAAGPDITARARWLVRNNGYAVNAVESWAANTVGDGIKPISKMGDAARKEELQRLWLAWTDEADAEGMTDFYGLQRRAAREVFMAGEVFFRIRMRRAGDGLSVPLQLQMLPAEMLPLEQTGTAANGNMIRQGIEFDRIGRRVAYHFLRRHPGDSTDPGLSGEIVRVPAAEVIHVIDPVEGGQLRGVSKLAPAIVKLFLLDQYDDAELDRKKVAAMYAMFVTSPAPENPLAPAEDEDAPAGVEISPGQIVRLDPGEDVTVGQPADSGATYEPFQYRTLLQISAALGIPYLQANIAGGEGFDWFYASEADRSAQVRTPISDGGAGKPWVFRYKDLRAWWSEPHFNRPGGVESGTPTAWVPQSKPVWFTELGCPAIDRGTNQPNVFFDPKSSESFTPYFSRGWRDDAIQRAYLEATYLWWGAAANNPLSTVYGGRMVHVPECAAWTWDARPYPFFPALEGVWTDGPNWRLGHWLTGRLGAVSLAALVRHLCLRAGMPAQRIDVSGLWGAVEGYVIGALESPRASITTLARHFGFDAVETGGVIRFVMRGRAGVAELGSDDLVAAPDPRAEGLELTRAQETELPQALKWQLARADEDYDAAQVEAQRITVSASRIASEAFPMAVAPEEAERRCRRALMEAWIGRETASFRLPPSRLALDPADVIRLAHDGRSLDFRLLSTADAEARGIEAIRQDRAAYDLPPGDPRPASLARPLVLVAPEVAFLDLPQLTEDQPAHRPFLAAHARPWPGELAVFRSPGSDGFDLLTTVPARARTGVLAFDLWPGPVSRFDLGNALTLDLFTGSLESVTDLALFGGANALAVEASPGVWEIVQAGMVELIAPARYRLTRLLRGQRGTEGAMGNPTPAGARVVVLDSTLTLLPIALGDIGLPWNWRVGPATRPPSDETYVAQAFTPAGAGLRPFAPVHVEQPWRRARSPGDLTMRWTRRSRALEVDAWEQVEVPLGEEVEGYELEIRDGATVRRVLTSSTTSVLYTAAQQATDWGAPLGPGDTLAIRIFQLSARLGRGAPASVTLQF